MGIGGGTILIPALTIFLKTPQHIAQSVNLLSFVPTAIVAIISHIKQGNIEKNITFKLILGGVLGAVIGSYFAIRLPGNILRRLFGGFLLIMGIYEVCCKKRCNKK
ncbi:MAG: hypothetical protein K0R09_923 [Clostridiales bacterium]|jgi:uncharacterized membrane protein YfcA|nr:hypothetical protein [Clostridiales bacterium]